MSNINAITYDDAHDVTVSDTVADPSGPFAGLMVTVAGTLKITTLRGTSIALAAVVAGQYVVVATQRVWSTGTTATVVGLSASGYQRLHT